MTAQRCIAYRSITLSNPEWLHRGAATNNFTTRNTLSEAIFNRTKPSEQSTVWIHMTKTRVFSLASITKNTNEPSEDVQSCNNDRNQVILRSQILLPPTPPLILTIRAIVPAYSTPLSPNRGGEWDISDKWAMNSRESSQAWNIERPPYPTLKCQRHGGVTRHRTSYKLRTIVSS